ncbi:MAG: hypothetical protein GXP25_24665 [Planctomycetes bacterium]|nr:hypothetical protein [Planctomycetota bacterium]
MAQDKEKDANAEEKGESPQAEPAEGQAAVASQGGGAPEGFTINEEDAYTTRADYFAGSFAITEAMLAFGSVDRQKGEIKLNAKIVVSIRDAKRILLTFQQLISQYEDKYGSISV